MIIPSFLSALLLSIAAANVHTVTKTSYQTSTATETVSVLAVGGIMQRIVVSMNNGHGEVFATTTEMLTAKQLVTVVSSGPCPTLTVTVTSTTSGLLKAGAAPTPVPRTGFKPPQAGAAKNPAPLARRPAMAPAARKPIAAPSRPVNVPVKNPDVVAAPATPAAPARAQAASVRNPVGPAARPVPARRPTPAAAVKVPQPPVAAVVESANKEDNDGTQQKEDAFPGLKPTSPNADLNVVHDKIPVQEVATEVKGTENGEKEGEAAKEAEVKEETVVVADAPAETKEETVAEVKKETAVQVQDVNQDQEKIINAGIVPQILPNKMIGRTFRPAGPAGN